MTGRVRWFDSKKGYGFIVADDTGRDVFVHFTGIVAEGFRELKTGRRVSFELSEDGARGVKAVEVTVIPRR